MIGKDDNAGAYTQLLRVEVGVPMGQLRVLGTKPMSPARTMSRRVLVDRSIGPG